MINKKIDLYINGIYICTSQKYKTCKEFSEKVKKDGFVRWASIPVDGFYKIKETDKVVCHFQK